MRESTEREAVATEEGTATESLVEIEDLVKHYPVREGLLNRQTGAIRAVDGIDFSVRAGETLGLIGESGCGKSTAASTVLRLEEPTEGSIRFDGADVTEFDGEQLTSFRRRTAMVFQDPTASLDPRMTVGESAAEPLAVNGVGRDRRRERVEYLFDRVGLGTETLDRYPHELSGGQKQRVGLARALSLDPEFVVLDEPVSALDVSVQAEILSLLAELQAEFDLSMLLISHDVSVVRNVCDRVAVMYAGELVERGETESVLTEPQHPYTEALAAAVPTPDPRAASVAATLSGDVPDPADPPSGCRFHPRCQSVIPPEDTDVSSETYAAIVGFRTALATGEVTRDRLTDLAAARYGIDTGAVTEDRRSETLRAEYDLPEEIGDDSVADTVAEAVSLAADGDDDAAHQLLSESFTSVCERENPDFYDTDAGQRAACHLHDA